MCERYGIVVCHTLDDMIEMLLAFQAGRLPKGPRVGWMTTSGGTVDLLYDYLEEIGRHRDAGIQRRDQGEAAPAGSQELALKNPLDAGNPDQRCLRRRALQARSPPTPTSTCSPGAARRRPASGVRDPAVTKPSSGITDKPVFGFIRMAAS